MVLCVNRDTSLEQGLYKPESARCSHREMHQILFSKLFVMFDLDFLTIDRFIDWGEGLLGVKFFELFLSPCFWVVRIFNLSFAFSLPTIFTPLELLLS